MNVLVFNCGSSSLKFRLIAMPEERELAAGEAQRIGPPTAKPSQLIHRSREQKVVRETPMRNHAEAFREVIAILASGPHTADVVAHRLVNGGPHLADQCIVTDAVLQHLEDARHLAPLHNPPAIETIRACRQCFPELPQLVISDTAFHRTIPDYARTYALPLELSRRTGMLKHGYHGISHEYVMTEAARFLNIPLNRFCAVSGHLGSGGASLCAIRNGQSVDNTMGYSPLQGLVMSTRCGDVDPGTMLYLLAVGGENPGALEHHLNTRSGVLGLSSRSADIRDSLETADDCSVDGATARTTADVYLWRLKKYLGAYLAVVGTPHAVIFTDTIGETVPAVRYSACCAMESFGLRIDPEKNEKVTQYPADVAHPDSAIRIIVVLTNEELAIARSASHTFSTSTLTGETR